MTKKNRYKTVKEGVKSKTYFGKPNPGRFKHVLKNRVIGDILRNFSGERLGLMT